MVVQSLLNIALWFAGENQNLSPGKARIMPLRDHFHPPLAGQRRWESFHAAWATEIMRTLNRSVLPSGCFAEAQVHVGSRVEIDVAAFTGETSPSSGPSEVKGSGVAAVTWAVSAPPLVMPAIFPDEIEVQVFHMSGGANLVAAIELVSPGNKDRPEARRAFAAKCLSYLQQGIGLVIVDIVSSRLQNLHDELIHLMDQPEGYEMPGAPALYAVAYRPSRRETGDHIEMWPIPVAIDRPLPVMPLALRGVATVPVDLEATYTMTCQDSRM
jgi:hypothetical protein